MSDRQAAAVLEPTMLPAVLPLLLQIPLAQQPSADPGGACAPHLAAGAMPPEQQAALRPWLRALGSAQPLLSEAAYPFCFVYGGRASSALLPTWRFAAAPVRPLPDFTGRTVHSFTWTEPAGGGGGSGCVVELNVTLFVAQPTAADAVLALRNAGASPTAAVTRPASLFTAWASSEPSHPARLHTRVGGNGSPSDFYPANPVPELRPAAPTTLQNQCGTGSYGTLPFFAIEWPTKRTGVRPLDSTLPLLIVLH